MKSLEIRNLTKSFGDFTLENINLTLPGGSVMGLVGENGAGKSTTIKLILGMLEKDGGSITILGKDNGDNIQMTKEDVGVVMDEVGIPECLTATQVGKIMRYTYKNWEIDTYMSYLKKLSVPENKPFGNFSKGMKMKLAIAVAMSHGARLLILDEATSGLDPVVRDEFTDMLCEFTRDENNSVLISSHIVSDLEKLCDYIAFMHKGKLLLCEEKDALLSKYGIIHCSVQSLSEIPAHLVRYKRETAFGAMAVVLRDADFGSLAVSPVSIEELFVCMVKEEL